MVENSENPALTPGADEVFDQDKKPETGSLQGESQGDTLSAPLVTHQEELTLLDSTPPPSPPSIPPAINLQKLEELGKDSSSNLLFHPATQPWHLIYAYHLKKKEWIGEAGYRERVANEWRGLLKTIAAHPMFSNPNPEVVSEARNQIMDAYSDKMITKGEVLTIYMSTLNWER